MVIFLLHENVCAVLRHGFRQGGAEGYRKSQASAYQYAFHLGKDVAYRKSLQRLVLTGQHSMNERRRIPYEEEYCNVDDIRQGLVVDTNEHQSFAIGI